MLKAFSDSFSRHFGEYRQSRFIRNSSLTLHCKQHGGWEVGIVGHAAGKQGVAVQPRRWVVERTFGWLVRNRRLAKDYERKTQTSETLIEVGTIRLLLRRRA